MKKYTVVTTNNEHGMVDVTHVEAADPHSAVDVAIESLIKEFLDEDSDEVDREEMFEREQVVVVLDGHCETAWNPSFEEAV